MTGTGADDRRLAHGRAHAQRGSVAQLPGSFYVSRSAFDASIEAIFSRSWQLVGDLRQLAGRSRLEPVSFLGGALDEPLLLTRDEKERLHVISNVCTHRGALLCDEGASARGIRCPYHGRRFGLDGTFRSAPGFTPIDGSNERNEDLPRFPHATWGPMIFAAIDPAGGFEETVGELPEILSWYPWDRLERAHELSRAFAVRASWALYCENYLEGLHIPFVHGGLSGEIELDTYRLRLFPQASLQIADSKGSERGFGPMAPAGDETVAAFYAFLFPNTMVNVYPWGVSINVVVPVSPDETIVRYSGYLLDRSRMGRGAGGDLDRVEKEDDAVVESCQRGVASRCYAPGRLSPRHERGVAHFRRLVNEALHEA